MKRDIDFYFVKKYLELIACYYFYNKTSSLILIIHITSQIQALMYEFDGILLLVQRLWQWISYKIGISNTNIKFKCVNVYIHLSFFTCKWFSIYYQKLMIEEVNQNMIAYPNMHLSIVSIIKLIKFLSSLFGSQKPFQILLACIFGHLVINYEFFKILKARVPKISTNLFMNMDCMF